MNSRLHRPSAPLWVAASCMLALAVLVIANLAAMEFGPLRGRAIQVDEVFFAVCAARDNAVGDFPSFGCHDQKTPLIYATHQVVQWASGTYSLPGIKVAAFALILIGAALVAALTRRLAGTVGAMAAAALFQLTIGIDASLLALKSEVLGTSFLLCGLLVLARGGGAPRTRHWALCGLFFGGAFMVKQTFAFATVVSVMALLLTAARSPQPRWGTALGHAVALCAASLVPLLLSALLFAWQGRLPEFLASIFLYPSIYKAPGGDLGVLRPLLWRVGSVFEDMGRTPLVAMLAVTAAAMGTGLAKGADKTPATSNPAWNVLLACAAGMLLVVFISPIYFSYHLLPAWMLLSVMAGVLVQRLADGHSSDRRLAAGVAAAMVLPAAMMAATSWYTSGGKAKHLNAGAAPPTIAGAKGEYAYVLGTWPDFYFSSELIPASHVLFPWSLPGAPQYWSYAPPDPGSLRGRWLARVQERAAQQLMSDFERTPPSYVVVSHDMARAPGSPRVTDIRILDDYLRQRCSYLRPAPENLGSAQSLFACNSRRAVGSAP
jgi:hypothetical protein